LPWPVVGPQPGQLQQIRRPDAGAGLAVSAKDKITDAWDHFDVKAILPEHAADLGTVFGTQEEIGRKMT
jgi:hypothetical protein